MASTFSKLYSTTLTDPLLKRGSDKIIYSYYLTNSSRFGYAWPSRARVARECAVDPSTVKRSIRYLKKIGYLRLRTQGGVKGRFYDTNQFFVKKPAAQLPPSKPKLGLEEQLKKDKAIFLSLAGRIGVRVDDALALLAPVEIKRAERALDASSPHTLAHLIAKNQLEKLTKNP